MEEDNSPQTMTEEIVSDHLYGGRILLPYTHDRVQVWDPQAVNKLWTQHGIVGHLVGSLPRQPHQSNTMGLPLSLMPEEVKVMIEEGIGSSVVYGEMEDEPSQEIKCEFAEYRKRVCEEQVVEARRQRKREVEMMADRILAGKKKKFEERKRKMEGSVSHQRGAKMRRNNWETMSRNEENKVKFEKENLVKLITIRDKEGVEKKITLKEKKKTIDEQGQMTTRANESRVPGGSKDGKVEEKFTLTREQIIEEEMGKIKKLPENMQAIEIFTQNPFITRLQPEPYSPDSKGNTRDLTRYAVFRDLWHRGYYVTQGLKFGGDFLAYPGDPHLYHACFIVRCVEDVSHVSVRDLVAATRTASATKKTFVLAALDPESTTKEVKYRSYQWAEED